MKLTNERTFDLFSQEKESDIIYSCKFDKIQHTVTKKAIQKRLTIFKEVVIVKLW